MLPRPPATAARSRRDAHRRRSGRRRLAEAGNGPHAVCLGRTCCPPCTRHDLGVKRRGTPAVRPQLPPISFPRFSWLVSLRSAQRDGPAPVLRKGVSGNSFTFIARMPDCPFVIFGAGAGLFGNAPAGHARQAARISSAVSAPPDHRYSRLSLDAPAEVAAATNASGRTGSRTLTLPLVSLRCQVLSLPPDISTFTTTLSLP